MQQLLWHLFLQHLSGQHLSLLAISQPLLNQFGRTFNGRFQGPSLPDVIGQGDICPGNICHGDICTFRQYIHCSWPNFNNFFEPTFWVKEFFATKICYIQTFVTQKFFGPIWQTSFCTQNFSNPKFKSTFMGSQFFVSEFLDQNLLGWRKKVWAEKSSNRRKSRTFFLSNFFPTNTFLVYMEAKVVQEWHTTHFKACSKW